MTGMLKKDLMLTWKNMKSLLLALVVFLVGSFSQTGLRVLLIGLYLCLLGVLTPIYAFSYDKLAGWDGYARALPVSRWKIVLAKYLLGVVFLAAALVVGVLIAVGSKAAGIELDLGESVSFLAGFAAGGLLFLSAQIPVIYRFGPEKARIFVVVGVFLVTVVLGALLRFGENISFLQAVLHPSGLLAAGFAALVILISVGSFFLSVRIYKKRSF